MAVFDGLDLYVDNAAGTWHEAITKLTSDSWEKTQTTNVSACAYACREVGRRLIGQGRGSGLSLGRRPPTFPFTVIGLPGIEGRIEHRWRCWRSSYPFGIRVNLLTPGAFITEAYEESVAASDGRLLIPLRRAGEVRVLSAAALLLLSDRLSSYTVGAELVVDGGFRLRPMDILTDEERRAPNAPDD